MDPEGLKAAILDAVPWVKMSGITINLFTQGHVKLSVPAANHLNHVGIMYAGSHFMLMEVAGAALFLATYGADKFLPINKGMSIRFLKPAITGITCELRMDASEAREKIQTHRREGKR